MLGRKIQKGDNGGERFGGIVVVGGVILYGVTRQGSRINWYWSRLKQSEGGHCACR